MICDQYKDANPSQTLVHATCVALQGRGVLIIGVSGSGKSGLALALMALGAKLVADDQVVLARSETQIQARAPTSIRGLIEARGIGLLYADVEQDVPLHLVVNLDETETVRLPNRRFITILDQEFPLLHKVDSAHFPAALVQFLAAGRREE